MEQVSVGGDYGTAGRGSAKKALSCGGGGFIVRVDGNHDHNVNVKKLTSVKCKSVYDDSTYEVSSDLGTENKGTSGFNTCEGSGLVGFRIGTHENVETLYPICKPWGSNTVDFSSPSRMGKSQKTWNTSCRMGVDGKKQDMSQYDAGPFTYIQTLTGYDGQKWGNLVGLGYTCTNLEHVLPYRKDNPDVMPKVDCCTNPNPGFGCSQMKMAMAAGRPSFDCESVMDNYCDGQSGKFMQPPCDRWFSDPGRKRKRAAKLWEYCQAGNNFDTTACKEFCTVDTGAATEFPEYKAMCNTLYDTKCADEANLSRDVCSCHRPFGTYKNADLITKIHGLEDPRCYFQECIKTGYHKMYREQLGCPKCLQNLQVNVDAATDTELTNIKNVCNVPGTEQSPPPPPPPFDPPSPLTPFTTDQETPNVTVTNNNTVIIVGVAGGMLFLLFLIALA